MTAFKDLWHQSTWLCETNIRTDDKHTSHSEMQIISSWHKKCKCIWIKYLHCISTLHVALLYLLTL